MAYGERLTTHCQWGWLVSFFYFFFVPDDLDLWVFDLDIQTFDRGTKHVFPVNLVQIRSEVPEIHKQTNKQKQEVTDSTKNRTLLACGKYTDEQFTNIKVAHMGVRVMLFPVWTKQWNAVTLHVIEPAQEEEELLLNCYKTFHHDKWHNFCGLHCKIIILNYAVDIEKTRVISTSGTLQR